MVWTLELMVVMRGMINEKSMMCWHEKVLKMGFCGDSEFKSECGLSSKICEFDSAGLQISDGIEIRIRF